MHSKVSVMIYLVLFERLPCLSNLRSYVVIKETAWASVKLDQEIPVWIFYRLPMLKGHYVDL